MDDYAVCSSSRVSAKLRPINEQAGYQKSVKVYNNTGQCIVITERNGLPTRISSTNIRDGKVIIEITHNLALGSAVDPHGRFTHLVGDDAESIALLEALRLVDNEGLKLGVSDSSRRAKTFVIRHEIDRELFLQYGKDLYILELDILVSKTNENDYADHPYSRGNERLDKIYGEVGPEGVDAFKQSMFIISNNKEVNAKYINYNGRVYRIPSVVNNRLQDGLYVYGSVPTKRDVVPMKDGLRLDIEEGKKLYNLFDTAEEASIYGNMSTQKDIELEELKQETKQLEASLKHQRLEHEREIEYAKQEAAFDEEKRQRRMREEKEHFESRSYIRKDSSELMKMLPVIVSGLLSLIAIFMKIKS